MINCSKIVVSAMHGPAVGAGLVAGAAGRHLDRGEERAHHRRPHAPRRRRRRPRGDRLAAAVRHGEGEVLPAALRAVSGEEAERIGLVSLTCEEAELQEKALEVARKLAAGAQTALRWTKYSLNNWLRMAGPAFDASLALEMLGFTGPEVKEGLASLREKREPKFPPEPKDF